jgi:hypothetical protein
MEYSGSAELAIAGLAEKVYGAVSQITDKGCVVRLQKRPEGTDTLAEGTQADVTMHISGTVFNAPVEVVSDAGGEIRLHFMAPVRRFQARNDYHLECRLPIIVRTVNPNGCVGAWRIAETFDISVVGLGVHVDPPFRHDGHIEICLRLPGDNRALRTTCRPAYRRVLPDGHVALGLHFSSISGLDKVRLSSFIAESLGAAAAA